MIRSLEIKNFRCARDVRLNLAPVTALVGANGAGKTALIDAIAGRWRGGVTDFWRHDPASAWSVTATTTDGVTVSYNASEPHQQGWSAQYLRLDLDRLRNPQAVQQTRLLESNGTGLANVIATSARALQADLAKRFCELLPMYSDVDLVPSQSKQGFHDLRFHDRWAPDVHYGPEEVSDGTLLVLAFLAIPFQAAAVDLLAIEEPERGLHPYLMGQVIDLFRSLSSPDRKRPIQVLLATHSAELLEHLRPEEVRFVSRDQADGSTRVHEVDSSRPQWREAFREYEESLGAAWLSGALGGVPG